MKASELIDKLKADILIHGDLEVYRGDAEGESELAEVLIDVPKDGSGVTTKAIILW
jgi:hypothetical protein